MTSGSRKYARRSSEAVNYPAGFTQTLRCSLRHAFLSTVAHFSGPLPRAFLCCLYCHNVFDDEVEAFEQMIRALMALGTFVTTDRCLSLLAGTELLVQPYFHLSFDDGFKNLLYNAAPVLSVLGVPAAGFVPTAIVGAVFEVVSQYCLTTIRHAAPIEVLSWPDLAELRSAGFTIGSHTRRHARLSDLVTEHALYEELSLSKRDIENKLGVACKYIAWPYGTRNDTTSRCRAYVQDCGYAACFGGFRGMVAPGNTDRYSIPRHHFEPVWPIQHVKYLIATPSPVARQETRSLADCCESLPK
jgi:peptidoglycan/xylan/chitin deacetylase (PgdA/CDA1 family)